MPAESGMAFVLIQHLDPTHESLMVDLLSRQTQMKVIQVEDHMEVEANHVYMIPPNLDLAIQNGELLLTTPVQRRGMRMPIDFFFKSLAQDQKEKAICIILSGTGSDGTAGLKAVKAYGGIVVAQSPEEAQYDGMPSSAIATGVVDHVIPVNEMPERLLSYIQHSYVRGYFGTEPIEINEPDAFNNILAILHAQLGHDFRYYKKSTVIRRIKRRLSLHQLDLLRDYVTYLRQNADETRELFKDLLIGVTGFFREKEPWELLDEIAISALVKAPHDEKPIRVWVPGCASGEEAYTIAIILHEKSAELNLRSEFQIFATDIDANALDFARAGRYPESISSDIPKPLLDKYFKRDDGFYHVTNKLREDIVFSSQNLISDPPFSKLDLISCRNLLIYIDASIQEMIIQLFHFSLNKGGFLLLGNAETIGKRTELFEPLSKKWRIYRRLETNLPLKRNFPIVPDERGWHRLYLTEEDKREPSVKPADIVKEALLEKYAPSSVLINRNHEVLYHFGETGQYLDFPTGEHSNDLYILVRDGLSTRIRGAVHKSIHTNGPVSIFGARVKRDGKHYKVEINVTPLKVQGAEGLLLVSFRDVVDSESQQTQEVVQGGDDAAFKLLEHELNSTRSELQNTIEELETSNEELKASNEEIMSMNEELQSSNEELETSKEELQSLNEELNTVNNELQEKVRAQEQANDDLMNLVNSTDIAAIFLNPELCIKQYTPASKDLFNLIPTDIDRPIRHITTRFYDPDLANDARKVLNTLEVASKEVQNDEKRWYQRKIFPYRTHDNRIQGIVITFEEITEVRRSRDMLAEQNLQYADAQAIAHFGYWTVDLKTNKLDWSDEVYKIFEIQRDAFSASYEAFLEAVHPEDRNLVNDAYTQSVKNKTPYNITHRILLNDGRVKYVNEICRTEYDSDGHPIRSVGTIQDITALKELKKNLRTSQTRYKALFDHLNSGVAVYKAVDNGDDFIFLDFNPAGERIEEIAKRDLIGKRLTQVFPGVREFGLLEVLKRVWQTGQSEQYPDAFYQDGRITGWRNNEIYRLPSGEVVAVYSDITSQKGIERSLHVSQSEKELILDAVSDVILHLGTDRKIRWASKTAADTFGRTRDELIGLQCHTVCAQEDAACQKCPFTRSLSSRQIEQGQLTDLRGRLWNVVAKPLFDDKDNILGVVEIRSRNNP